MSWTQEQLEVGRNLLDHYGYPGGYPGGSFTTAIFHCLAVADVRNMAKLLLAFPEFSEPLMYFQACGPVKLELKLDHEGVSTNEAPI